MEVKFKVYRYNPEVDNKPYYKDYTVTVENAGTKVLTGIELIKQQDSTLAVRRSCRERALARVLDVATENETIPWNHC